MYILLITIYICYLNVTGCIIIRALSFLSVYNAFTLFHHMIRILKDPKIKNFPRNKIVRLQEKYDKHNLVNFLILILFKS